jgi:hypothetical protein
MHDIKSMTEKNAPTSLAISMAMRIRWYGAKHITQYGRSWATLDATGRRHQASICPILPPADAMVINFGLKNRVVAL